MPEKPRSGFTRRDVLTLTAGAAALAGVAGAYRAQPEVLPPPDDGWWAGDLAHLLPTVDHQRFIIKTSFHRPPAAPPRLKLGDRTLAGQQTDSEGLFYRFDVDGLLPQTQYRLQLVQPDGSPLCDDWPLKTFPAPDAHVSSFRLLAYTCAGGPENLYNFGFFNAYLPNATRQQLFARALSYQPDAVVANGDHVYWDLKSSVFMGNSLRARSVAGLFDRQQAVLGTVNEDVLKRAFGPQIAGLYGVRFRSTPMFFLQDDHDYGENDEADEHLRTFPPDPFMLDLARSTQQLYYPELLCDEHLPRAFRHSRRGTAENFGALRYGKLFEGLLYDCRRYLSNSLDARLGHETSLFVPPSIEQWLIERSLRSPAKHVAHIPSTPVLWTAGKWAEWYPDTRQGDGSLGIRDTKPFWPRGWLDQHDRLMEAAISRFDRRPLFISGDLHATGSGRILANQGKSYTDNPVLSVLTGAIGTGALGWPSKFRGTLPRPSVLLETEILAEPVEENGFTLMDFSPHDLTLSHFKWLPEHGLEHIARLEPFATLSQPTARRS